MVQDETLQTSIEEEIDKMYESCKKLDYLINKLDFLLLELKPLCEYKNKKRSK